MRAILHSRAKSMNEITGTSELKCLPWNINVVKFDLNWSVHEAK
jgi:hypothetical protein